MQAENAPSMKRSLEAGEAITLDSVRTFADGIAVKHPGDITLDMVRKYVDEVVTVSEDEIAAAILALDFAGQAAFGVLSRSLRPCSASCRLPAKRSAA